MLWNPQILESLRKDAAFQAAEASLLSQVHKPVNFFGLDDSAKALAALSLAYARREEGKGGLLYVAPDNLRLRSLKEDIQALSGLHCPVFRALPSDLLATGTGSREGEIERLFLLARLETGALPILLCSASALREALPTPEDFAKRLLKLRLGEDVDRDNLLAKLEEMGYERCRQVETSAQVAVRGDIIDIGMRLLRPRTEVEGECIGLRLSFFDREIEAIRYFDPFSQRSVEELEEIMIPPTRELYIPNEAREELAKEIRKTRDQAIKEVRKRGGSHEEEERILKWSEEDADAIESGLDPAGLKRWEWLLRSEDATLLDYAQRQDMLLVLDEPALLRSRLDAGEAEFQQETRALLLMGKILPQALERHRDPAEVFRRVDQYRPILGLAQIASSGNGLPGGISLQTNSHPADHYRGKEKFLFSDLQQWQREKWTIVLSASGERRQKRLREILNEQSLTLPIHPINLSEGFVWTAAELAVLGNMNLFGSERRQSRKRKGISGTPILFYGDLNIGEYVVHEDHGIGRYCGIKTLETSGVKRDYFLIAYADEDKLYIPVDHLDEIRKYVAGENKKPRISRLGSSEWERKKTRARESIRKLATNLLEVYAKRSREEGHACQPDTIWQQEFEEAFPYEETEDQLRAIQEVKKDMESHKIMDRLLCGDVGFGKTEIAFRALFKAVMEGKQGAMLVPTTVLAQQHYDSLQARLGEFPLRVRLLSRFVSAEKSKEIKKAMKEGEVDIVIGTHRVLSKDVSFKNLGLLVIDEEQRFGVDHKESLKAKYPLVDVLTLTATPIPRTLHMSMSGIRDISVLEEGPEDRRPVQTYVMEADEGIIDEAILREVGREGQVFYLYNDTRKLAGITKKLLERLPGIRVTYAHGQMSEKRLEEAITGFANKEFDVLVCTTIIESGIDMPNVNTIIVENADRLGLAQLYQIRGRVGRSERQAYAYITYHPDKVLNEDARKRLAAIRDYTELGSGFRIALRDLEVRGAGNLLGGEQSGQLDAIGYDLYCRMLDETLRELKGEESLEKGAECLVDLPLDAMIPAQYVEDEGQRMEVYRKILDIRQGEDWHDMMDELLDRYGDPPKAVVQLLDISLARARATDCGIERIEQYGKDLRFLLKAGSGANEELFALFQKEANRGKILFNAGVKGFLLYQNAAADEDKMAEKLRNVFL